MFCITHTAAPAVLQAAQLHAKYERYTHVQMLHQHVLTILRSELLLQPIIVRV